MFSLNLGFNLNFANEMTPLLTIYVLLQMVVNIDGNIRDRFLLLKHAGNTKERFKVLIPEEVDYGRIYRKYPGKIVLFVFK